MNAVRSVFSNPGLRGFLYDHVGVAEIQERSEIIIKTKTGLAGGSIKTETRDAVRSFVDESGGEAAEPTYVLIRLLSRVAEPWDDLHPDPAFPLGEPD